jgi:cell division protein FtsW (lipid II flippase)
MKHIEPLSKRKKIINFILGILFIIFALLQLNDPDSTLWFFIYVIVAFICLYNNFKPIPRFFLVLTLVALLTYSVFHFSLFIDYLKTENKAELFGEMVYEKPYLEGSREFIGLLMAAFGVFYQLIGPKKSNL